MWLIDSSELEANSLKICALVASSGKSRTFRLQVCEDFMVALFGRSTCMHFSIGFMFMTSIALLMYWYTVPSSKYAPVAAISATNVLYICWSNFIQLLSWDST